MIVFAPLWLVLGLIGLFLLPGNLLVNLQLEIPESFQPYYWSAFLLVIVGLHASLDFKWRWAVLTLLALVLCVSSYGCYANDPSLHSL
jgi:hypothetical protein